ncbi:RNA polymerase subunit sigma-54 [Desulfuromonas versatilis]|uniref:HTH-type transcriptional regulatory protein TyrR n=1 Tax=Desulfuromonas versatilis TaxID=2802975 RepID=A0ABM8HU17_9BACT|nr:sigma 54-interacting transcriptional regulator [Desulfuromonas versatilis]BCR03984.1 RNA polymerase subunit sigma-54 [Desulfuromonas versatilis]
MDRELLEIVFDNVDNGIYLTDGNGVTIRVNRTFEEMSGIRNEELAGKSLRQLVAEGYFTGSASLLVLERRAPATVTYSTRTNRKLLVKGKPIFGADGEIRYVVNTIWDLTVVDYNREVDSDTARDQLLVEEDVIACSAPMMQVIDLALRVAGTDSTILLTGESGVGKSLVARMIHRTSERKAGPLMHINCAAIPESLIESELFGYEPGAFTGADRKGKRGLFEMAEGGTVFLDEISELPLHLQSKLLGVIQDKAFFRVGGRQLRSVDVRLVAATNKDLARMVAEGRFREDLYYRLNVVPLYIPPLRERCEDIPPLVGYFLERFNRKYRKYKRFSAKLMAALERLPWRGNIRELENFVERAVVTSSADEVALEVLPMGGTKGGLAEGMALKGALAEFEKQILLEAESRYRTTRGVAAALGISQASAARKLKQIKENGGLLDG